MFKSPSPLYIQSHINGTHTYTSYILPSTQIACLIQALFVDVLSSMNNTRLCIPNQLDHNLHLTITCTCVHTRQMTLLPQLTFCKCQRSTTPTSSAGVGLVERALLSSYMGTEDTTCLPLCAHPSRFHISQAVLHGQESSHSILGLAVGQSREARGFEDGSMMRNIAALFVSALSPEPCMTAMRWCSLTKPFDTAHAMADSRSFSMDPGLGVWI